MIPAGTTSEAAPDAVTFTTRLPSESGMYTVSSASTATPKTLSPGNVKLPVLSTDPAPEGVTFTMRPFP